MLDEINEKDATGEIAGIFDEVRHLWGVPYVSAIHRHLATRPGVLEWMWHAVAPVFRNGLAQEAGWNAADGLSLAPLDRIPRDALTVWGIDEPALATIKSVAEGFVRVAPVNMMFAGLVKALLQAQTPGSNPGEARTWSPPAALPVPPAMLAPDALDPATRGVLMQFASLSGGKPFVPGLYRMLAHWPGLLAHLSTVLVPRLTASETSSACDQLRMRIDVAVPAVLARLPAVQTKRPMPDATERGHFNAIGGTYRKSSPELVVLGRLIHASLP